MSEHSASSFPNKTGKIWYLKMITAEILTNRKVRNGANKKP